MKKYFKFFSFLLVIIFCYTLTSCGSNSSEPTKDEICKNHKDTNSDGICDTDGCTEKLSPEAENNDKDEQPGEDNTSKEENPDKIPEQTPEQEPVQTPEQTPENPSQPNPPCEVCVDLDENLICDACKKEIIPEPEKPKGAVLLKDGEVNFSIFLEYDKLSEDEISRVNDFIDFLKSIGILPEIYSEADSSDTETKIIIGSVSFLGEEYEIDTHFLGPQGYAVRSEGNEILLRAGSAKALGDAIEYLKEKAFSNPTLESAVFLFSDSVELIQTDYKFSDALIETNSIRDYKITYDKNDAEGLALAKEIQTALYENIGIWLSLTTEASDVGRYISVKSAARSGGTGFYVKITESDCLEITSEFKNKTLAAGKEYIASVFDGEGDTAKFTEAEINVRDIFYKDFGAVGDGKADDFNAIKATHNYANEYGHTVIADVGAKYYIGKTSDTITIRTDTRWGKAAFIIDDRALAYEEAKLSIFTVESDFNPLSIDSEVIEAINSSGGLARGSEKIELSLGYCAILIIASETATESILVDGDGNIAEGHELRSDFKEIKTIRALRADDTSITVEGGRFISYSNQNNGAEAFGRNIKVSRSNTTISGLIYEIEYEPEEETGASPYLAFIEIEKAYNVSVSDFTFSARREYIENVESPIISMSLSHKIILTRCDQDVDTFFAQDGFSQIEGFAGALRVYSSKDVAVTDSLINELYFDEDSYLITVENVKTHKTVSANGDVNATKSR